MPNRNYIVNIDPDKPYVDTEICYFFYVPQKYILFQMTYSVIFKKRMALNAIVNVQIVLKKF